VPAVTDRRRPRRPAVSGRAESNHKNSAADASDNSPDSVGDGRHADREGLGRSRGGLNTKLHLAADSRCRPISRVITAGQRHDAVAFEQVMAGIAIARAGRGRPRTRPDRVLADKAHSSKAIRAHLRRRGIKATIPEPANQQTHRARRGARGGRPPDFDPHAYRKRNTVEGAINKLKLYRAVATRYDKLAVMYRAGIDVATIRIWLRHPPP
jgi:transposase